jgi:predicted metallopeptidase
MSTKKLQIINENTGEIIEEAKFTGGYHVIYTNIDDMGRLKHIRELDNAKFGERHWIKNFVYRPIAKKLIEKFDELTPINPLRILFLEDMEYEKPAGGKNQWQAKISKANKQFSAMTGYDYILETRNYFIERMSREQIIALLYHELRHIDRSGELQPHDIEDWSNMVATLGKDWATTKAEIKNLIDDDIIWKELEPAAKQLDMFSLRLAK